MNFSVVLTQRCNMHCEHCYLPSVPFVPGVGDDLQENVYRQSIPLLAAQFAADIDEVYLTGGEYLVLSYGRTIVEDFRRFFSRSSIYCYTNGLLFRQDPTLFQDVRPDFFHVGIDEWHGTVSRDGSSAIADLFIEHLSNSKITQLIIHWTRKDGDEEMYDKFIARYLHAPNTIIEDRSLNTTTGRAAVLPVPNYRVDEVWRPCDIGDHLLAKYDGRCYGCHFSLPITVLGSLTDSDIRKKMDELRNSALAIIYQSPVSEKFYRHLCRKYHIEFTKNRCLLCEKFVYGGVDLHREAGEYLANNQLK